MGEAKRRLAPSEAKSHFMERLGLDESNEADQFLYQSMMVSLQRRSLNAGPNIHRLQLEAAAGYRRICDNRAALLWKLRDDVAMQPPFTFCQIREEALLTEIRYIYDSATPRTKVVYDLAGRSEGTEPHDNWVIRWLLWHAFRYRDSRNNKAQPGASNGKSSKSKSEGLSLRNFPDVYLTTASITTSCGCGSERAVLGSCPRALRLLRRCIQELPQRTLRS